MPHGLDAVLKKKDPRKRELSSSSPDRGQFDQPSAIAAVTSLPRQTLQLGPGAETNPSYPKLLVSGILS